MDKEDERRSDQDGKEDPNQEEAPENPQNTQQDPAHHTVDLHGPSTGNSPPSTNSDQEVPEEGAETENSHGIEVMLAAANVLDTFLGHREVSKALNNMDTAKRREVFSKISWYLGTFLVLFILGIEAVLFCTIFWSKGLRLLSFFTLIVRIVLKRTIFDPIVKVSFGFFVFSFFRLYSVFILKTAWICYFVVLFFMWGLDSRVTIGVLDVVIALVFGVAGILINFNVKYADPASLYWRFMIEWLSIYLFTLLNIGMVAYMLDRTRESLAKRALEGQNGSEEGIDVEAQNKALAPRKLRTYFRLIGFLSMVSLAASLPTFLIIWNCTMLYI
ncbi:uncharacterized protein NEMAJ01_0744 [Nematocida major]|uniref:uncharacterized protein n=1 Tax=Nematocida major TaxID=1912982 RepID=UPI002007B07E|nr:uncharacterized protein NEMAJ01_0744 [Nematocida major]KAH9385848.1 hypothetical protein NEMAJ01_0744 [Nematocida major]